MTKALIVTGLHQSNEPEETQCGDDRKWMTGRTSVILKRDVAADTGCFANLGYPFSVMRFEATHSSIDSASIN
jgi:hypothetical protein